MMGATVRAEGSGGTAVAIGTAATAAVATEAAAEAAGTAVTTSQRSLLPPIGKAIPDADGSQPVAGLLSEGALV